MAFDFISSIDLTSADQRCTWRLWRAQILFYLKWNIKIVIKELSKPSFRYSPNLRYFSGYNCARKLIAYNLQICFSAHVFPEKFFRQTYTYRQKCSLKCVSMYTNTSLHWSWNATACPYLAVRCARRKIPSNYKFKLLSNLETAPLGFSIFFLIRFLYYLIFI